MVTVNTVRAGAPLRVYGKQFPSRAPTGTNVLVRHRDNGRLGYCIGGIFSPGARHVNLATSFELP